MTDTAQAIDRLGDTIANGEEQEHATILSALSSIAHNAGRIASGGTNGPDGLELVAMSIARGDEPSLSASVSRVARAIEELASAVHDLAQKR